MRDADRGPLSCLTGRAKQTFKEAFATMTDDELRDIADSVVRPEVENTAGDRIEGSVLRDGHGGPVIFVRMGQEWKIRDM